MRKGLIILCVVLLVLISSGCTSQTETLYVCSTGEKVSDANLCPKVTTAPLTTTTPAPTTSAPRIKYTDKDTYAAEVIRAVEIISGTLKVITEATESHGEGQITRTDYKEIVILGKGNMESAEEIVNNLTPSPEFEASHNNLVSGIERFKKSFDELIAYGTNGDISHINTAASQMNLGSAYLDAATTALPTTG